MYIPDVPNVFYRRPATGMMTPLLGQPSRFTLDTSGVAGLLGGDEATSAMATVHVYENRRWLGWYNSPGSFQIAKRLRSLAKSGSFSGIFKTELSEKISGSIHVDPTTLFELDRWKGPKFQAAHSGTIIEETGYPAALFMKECASWNSEGRVVQGRRTQPVGITIADLSHIPAPEMRPARANGYTPLFASIPIISSVGSCILCAAYEDWFASSLIFLGIVASGVSCLVMGLGDFVFTHPDPAKGSPAGDGILTSDKEIVLLKGAEGAVNSITRGGFSLRFSSKAQYSLIRWCSILLLIQAIAQLLLISQATLFGQLMFVASLGISALYNFWVSSLDKEKIHRKLLFDSVLGNPKLTKYTLGTRTSAVVFILLVLNLQDPTKLLNELLPNDTEVWRRWKATIVERLSDSSDQSFRFAGADWELSELSQQEKNLLRQLYEDAQAAYNGYKDYLASESQ